MTLVWRPGYTWNETIWNPSMISTALWLDAADASTLFDATSGGSLVAADGTVARWEDKSGNSRHALQATSGDKPIRKTSIQNSKDIVRFNGTTQTMTGAHVLIPSSQSGCFMASVAFSSLTLTNQRILTIASPADAYMQFFNRFSSTSKLEAFGRGAASGENTSAVTTTTATGAYNIFTSRFNDVAGRVEAAINAEAFTATDNGSAFTAAPPTRFQLGAITTNIDTTQYLSGDIAEVIVLASIPTTLNRQRIEGYLAHKWGLTANLPNDHPYKLVGPTP